MIFDERDHRRLARLFNGRCDKWGDLETFDNSPRQPYAGYKPDVREAPNGDTKACPAGCEALTRQGHDRVGCSHCRGTGRVPNTDAGKRYLHVADKYNPPAWAREYQDRAYAEACRVANALKVPDAYYPRPETGALRVLEYLPGAGSAEHKDFDLFTIVLWRSTPKDLERLGPHVWVGEYGDVYCEHCLEGLIGREEEKSCPKAINDGFAKGVPEDHAIDAWCLNPGLHIGELGELVGLGPATPHRVLARPYVQKSIIYFALPAHSAELPGGRSTWQGDPGGTYVPGQTVGEWLAKRMARSRVEGYK